MITESQGLGALRVEMSVFYRCSSTRVFKVWDSGPPLRELKSPPIIITFINVIDVALYVPRRFKKRFQQ